ncbi:MAG: PhoH family protein [Francisella endosymbiont of Hyalomma scupense]
MSKAQFVLEPYKYDAIMLLCGNLDENIHAIENYFNVEIRYRADEFEITSDSSANNTQAKRFIKSYYAEILAGNTEFDLEQITTIFNAVTKDKATATAKSRKKVEEAEVQLRSKKLKARTHNQAIYLENIKNNFVIFGIGPAGTGKTYIAIACAVAAHQKGEVRRIVLIRPTVEAGEKLGFLPGDLTQKIDPYLRPMYDALFDFMGVKKVIKLIEKQAIEIAPLAYMFGRTINDSFIVLDESQNTTKEQIKMFLTRISFNTIAVITGDITQIDLPKNVTSGLSHALSILNDIEGVAISYLKSVDIVRHQVVRKIVNAYDKHEEKTKNG